MIVSPNIMNKAATENHQSRLCDEKPRHSSRYLTS
nr:MAG TPA: hypothetical protein [Caudoviricetes sp.]